MNMSWQPIETAPKDGTPVLCGWQRSGDRGFLVWKHNHRIKDAHEQGSMMDHAEDYFGDPIEYDDYDLAIPSGGPTHWFDLPRLQLHNGVRGWDGDSFNLYGTRLDNRAKDNE